MIDLPLSEDESVCIDTMVSPIFCRLKGDVTQLTIGDTYHHLEIYGYQTYIAVWDIKERFYLYINARLVPVLDYEDYFQFYDRDDNHWRNWDDTVILPIAL